MVGTVFPPSPLDIPSPEAIKGQGRVCLDVDECEDAMMRAECTQRGGVCTNRPGDHQCLCPSGRTCLRELATIGWE